MPRTMVLPGALLVAAILAGCSNAGSDRALGISATGIVKGTVFFDGNGTKALDAPPSADTRLPGVTVRLLLRGTSDTVAEALSDANGDYRMTGVPVGSYVAVVDQSILSDTAELVSAGTTNLTVTPSDSVVFGVGIGYPHVTVAQARTMPRGRRVFVEGVALNGRATFSDTTVHLADTSGFIRMTLVRLTIPPISTADSIRVVAKTGVRDGQPTVEDVTPLFIFSSTFLPTAANLTSAAAAAGGVAGSLDAAFVRVPLATISDTLRVAGDMRLTVSDSSGNLEVLLDRAVPGFLPATGPNPPPYVYVPGNKFDIVGVLVPTGVAGVWRLKPRSITDLVQR